MAECSVALSKDDTSVSARPIANFKVLQREITFSCLCSVFFSLNALFGLVSGIFLPSATQWALAGRESFLQGSLLGLIYEIARASVRFPSFRANSFFPALVYLSLVTLVVAVVCSLSCVIAALLFPKRANGLCKWSGALTFFAYSFVTLATALTLTFERGEFLPSMIDGAALLSASLSLLGLFAIAFYKNKAQAAFSFVLSLCSIASALLPFAARGELFEKIRLLCLGSGNLPPTVAVVGYCFLAVSALNAVVGAFTLNVKKIWKWNIARFSLQTFFSFLFITTIAAEEGALAPFFERPIVGSLILIIPFFSFLLSAFCSLLYDKAS